MKFQIRKNKEFNLLLVKGENQFSKTTIPGVIVPKIVDSRPQLVSIFETSSYSKSNENKDSLNLNEGIA